MDQEVKRPGRAGAVCRTLWTTRILATTALFSIAAPLGMQAFAQEDGDTAGAEAGQSARQLDKVTVTARRVEEDLQNSPVAVSAFNADTLELRSTLQLDDVARFSPNVAAYPGGFSVSNSAQFFIRGIGQFDYLVTTDPGVGVYLDGVYLARTTGSLLDLADAERVEVLRGPQGTLYGKNALGGAINVISRRPSETFRGRASVTVGEFDRQDVYLSLSGPLAGDKLAGSIALVSQRRDGFIERVLEPGETQGDIDTLAGRAALRWTPTDSFSLDLALDATKTDTNHGPYRYGGRFTDIPATLYNLADPGGVDQYDSPNLYESYAVGLNEAQQDIWGISAIAEWDLDGAVLTSTSSFRSSDQYTAGDMDGTPFEIIDEIDDIDQDQFTQEFKLSGNAFSGDLSYTTGLFFMSEEAEHLIDVDILSDLPVLPAPGVNDRILEIGQDQRSYAVYGQADYHFTDQLFATIGARYTYEEKDFSIFNYRDVIDLVTMPRSEFSESWDALTPRFGLNYQINEDVLVYGSIAQGFKSGGFNGRTGSPGAEGPYDPEYVWTYEAGLKSELLNRRLRLNAAAFWNDYQDLQFSVSSLAPNGTDLIITLENAAAAEIKGFEIEIAALPFENFELNASAGYLDAKFTEVDPGAEEVTEDSQLMGAPEWTTSLAGVYTIPVTGFGEFRLAADYSSRSKIYYNPLNTDLITGPVELVNAQVSFTPDNTDWTLTAGVTNLFDEEYYASGLGPAGLGVVRGVVGRPQEWFARATYTF